MQRKDMLKAMSTVCDLSLLLGGMIVTVKARHYYIGWPG